LVLDFEFTYHICPNKDLFSTYDFVDSSIVNMGNNAQYKLARVGTIQIKTHDGVVKTATKVWRIPNLE